MVVGIADMGEITRSKGSDPDAALYRGGITIAVAISISVTNLIQPVPALIRWRARHCWPRGARGLAEFWKRSSEAKTGIERRNRSHPLQRNLGDGRHDILAVMFFALFFGIGLLLVNTPRSQTLKHAFEGACSRCR